MRLALPLALALTACGANPGPVGSTTGGGAGPSSTGSSTGGTGTSGSTGGTTGGGTTGSAQCGSGDVGGSTGNPDAGYSCLCGYQFHCTDQTYYGATCAPGQDGGPSTCRCYFRDGGEDGPRVAGPGCCTEAFTACGLGP